MPATLAAVAGEFNPSHIPRVHLLVYPVKVLPRAVPYGNILVWKPESSAAWRSPLPKSSCKPASFGLCRPLPEAARMLWTPERVWACNLHLPGLRAPPSAVQTRVRRRVHDQPQDQDRGIGPFSHIEPASSSGAGLAEKGYSVLRPNRRSLGSHEPLSSAFGAALAESQGYSTI